MNRKIRIGVLCPASIAQNRFMPALQKCAQFEYVGVAHASEEERFTSVETRDPAVLARSAEKAELFRAQFGGSVFHSYREMIDSNAVDAVYLPLPPALHFFWAEKALVSGKHVFLEKPSTTAVTDTKQLLDLASRQGLALCENYMFQFHRQMQEIQVLLKAGHIGELRLVRINFGFPFRGAGDFRYDREMGGGSLLDCGGYTLKLASLLLGEGTHLVDAALFEDNRFSVDLYGNAVLRNDSGTTAQVAFGMDNQYRCQLELWGSYGFLTADRIFTAPPDCAPTLVLERGSERKIITVSPDDQFYRSIQDFYECIIDRGMRTLRAMEMLQQSRLVAALQAINRGERD